MRGGVGSTVLGDMKEKRIYSAGKPGGGGGHVRPESKHQQGSRDRL